MKQFFSSSKIGFLKNPVPIIDLAFRQSNSSSVCTSLYNKQSLFSSTCTIPVSLSTSTTSSSSSSFLPTSIFSTSSSVSLPGLIWDYNPFVPGIGENDGEGSSIRMPALPILAVPKRKHSYSRKRHRQSNPLYQEEIISHIYPCPKCSKGLLKMRHHICPCDQDKIGVNGVVRITNSGEKGNTT